jgi:hypothetical protein
MSTGLTNVYVIEKDVNSDLIAWGYPSIDVKLEAMLKDRCSLNIASSVGTFFCSRYEQQWQYFLSSPVSVKGSKVTAVSIVIIATEYNCGKFEALLGLLVKQYLSGDLSMVPVQQTFLSAYAAGKASVDGVKWVSSQFEPRLSLITPVHVLVETFGLEIALIWVAVLCKQRVVLYHTKPDELTQLVRAVSAVGGWHRRSWGLLRPLTGFSESEAADLKAQGYYIAGTTSAAAQERADLWDVYIDVPARTVTVNPKVKAMFGMGKYHKQVSEGFLRAYEEANPAAGAYDDAAAAQALIKAVAVKTNELLEQLQGCKGTHADGEYVTMTDIQAKNLPPNMEGFLFNVAVAEGLTRPTAV